VITSRIALALLTLFASSTTALWSQTVRVGVHSVAMTHNEVNESRTAEGVGGAASLMLRWRRLGLEAVGLRARMKPDSADLREFDVLQWDVRFSFWVAPVVAIEIGGGARTIDPEFAAPDVGAIRIGFVSEYPMARIASVRARGAYLVNPRFNGGGEAGLAVELGLGVAVGTANGRFRVNAESQFQRIDREVNSVEVPIQVTLATLGVELGF
jgi:hypothetical protein